MFMRWWTVNSLHNESYTSWKRRLRSIALVGAAGLMLSGCSLLPAEPEEEVLPPITPPTISKKPEYEVRTETIETKVSGSGKLMSQREEKVYFTLDGMHVKELFVKPGDKVKAGQQIAVLDVEELEKQIRQKKLQIRKAEVQMKETLRKKRRDGPSRI